MGKYDEEDENVEIGTDEATFSQPDPWGGGTGSFRYDAIFRVGEQPARIIEAKAHESKATGNPSYKFGLGLESQAEGAAGCKLDIYVPRVGSRWRDFLGSVAPDLIGRKGVTLAAFYGRDVIVEVEEDQDQNGNVRPKAWPDKVWADPAAVQKKQDQSQTSKAPSGGGAADLYGEIPF